MVINPFQSQYVMGYKFFGPYSSRTCHERSSCFLSVSLYVAIRIITIVFHYIISSYSMMVFNGSDYDCYYGDSNYQS